MDGPTPEAMRIGEYLAEFSPPSYRGQFKVEDWAEIVECVWAAEDLLGEPPVDLDGRPRFQTPSGPRS
jgi:hypothetical protein